MSVEMKTDVPVKSSSAVVGTVSYPVFDEKNPAIGLSDIMSYDWKSQGYLGPEHAIVSLVNTQHATNLKNACRQKANPKLTNEKLSQLVTIAMSRWAAEASPEDLRALQSDESKVLAKYEELKAKIKAEHEAKAKAVTTEDEEES